MHWPEEDSVSILQISSIIGGSDVGDNIHVKIGRSRYPGKILAVGMSLNLKQLYIQRGPSMEVKVVQPDTRAYI